MARRSASARSATSPRAAAETAASLPPRDPDVVAAATAFRRVPPSPEGAPVFDPPDPAAGEDEDAPPGEPSGVPESTPPSARSPLAGSAVGRSAALANWPRKLVVFS
jgi:hypothetical protein